MRTSDPGSAAPCGSAPGSPVPPAGSSYWRFYDRVAQAQLAAWLPAEPQRVLDVSTDPCFAAQLVAAGHEVLQVVPHADGPDGELALGPAREAAAGPGRLLPVAADSRSLGWLADGSVDLVLAESRALSLCLATELTTDHLTRVLRPGGRLLLVVDSLMLGLARLAEQGRWAELVDAPSADVVLVPDDDGSLTRCFWPEALHALLTGAGLEVDWVRPRTVLSPATVERALQNGSDLALSTLVATELALAVEREGESTGLHLVASARRPDSAREGEAVEGQPVER